MFSALVAGCGWVGLELRDLADGGSGGYLDGDGAPIDVLDGGGLDGDADTLVDDASLDASQLVIDGAIVDDDASPADGATSDADVLDGAASDGAASDASADAASADAGVVPCPDADGDGVCDAADVCPGSPDSVDADRDGTPDGCDGCPTDATKVAPGVCGCGVIAPPAYVNRYAFDERSGTVASDSMGGRNATLSNFPAAPWVAGQINNGLSFDGVNDVASAGALPSSLRSIAFWLRADTYGVVTSQSAWTAPTSTGSPANDWQNPANAFADDGRYTNYGAFLGFAQSQDYGGFAFGLPSGAVIKGIEVQSDSSNAGGLTSAFGISMSWNAGANQSTRQDAPVVLSGVRNYGSTTDLWGHAWTANEFLPANFRLRLQSTGIPLIQLSLGVDYVAARVNYSPITIPRVVLSLSPTVRVETNGPTISLVGFPSGTLVYVDGVASTAINNAFHHIAIVMPSALTASDLTFGGPATFGAYLDGTLDEARFYAAPLSASDVRTVFSIPACIP